MQTTIRSAQVHVNNSRESGDYEMAETKGRAYKGAIRVPRGDCHSRARTAAEISGNAGHTHENENEYGVL